MAGPLTPIAGASGSLPLQPAGSGAGGTSATTMPWPPVAGATGSGGSSAMQEPVAGAAGAAGTSAMMEPPSTGAFPPVQDFAAMGPFETMQEAGGASCTIFRPTTLGENGLLHPIIVWGNGTFTTPPIYQGILTHWASHGFIAAAANTSNAGTGQEMLACADWVLAENTRPGSAYEGKVDGEHIGASGHSQGGGGTIMAGRDARIDATAPLQPFTIGLGHDVASQSQQVGPMFLMSGANDTIAAPMANQQPVFDNSNVPTIWGTLAGADHLISAIGDITGYRAPATAWFRLHLMGDESGRNLFYGAACGLCSDTMWAVQRKDLE